METMWMILFVIFAEQTHAVVINRTAPVSVYLDGFTLEQWNRQSIWNQTRTLITDHLNAFCKTDRRCQADYGIGNLHLLHVIQSNPSTLHVNISVDEPILSNPDQQSAKYNYTALLTAALFQAKIDLENLHDNQRTDRISHSSNSQNEGGASRFLLILLGISLVTLVFALTILFVQRIRQHHYTNLLKQSTSTPENFAS